MTAAKEYRSPKEPETLTQQEAVDRLAECDHAFVSESFARGVCRAFGVADFVTKRKIDRTEFKGLNQGWDDDGNELPDGTVVYGADAASLATYLCNQLDVPHMGMLGRGSQLRSCVRALRDYLGAGGKVV